MKGYTPQPDGSVKVEGAGYTISADLWEKFISEGRHPEADHDFVLGERIEEYGVSEKWHRVKARCTRCGEEREVYHGVNMRSLNMEWCIPLKRQRLVQWLDRLLVVK